MSSARGAGRANPSRTPLLDRVSQPEDLRRIPVADLPRLAAEIRSELIEIVSRNGGHLGASLGTVELALALHYVYESPNDAIVWDVGHQAYAHKLLTGRRDRFGTIRQEGGLSGFLSRDESEHDAFGAGHASTAISAALGMAVAHQQCGQTSRRVAAVIGDGALTGGMAFEALNNAGMLNLPFLVVLNDNEMSIAPNVGALSRYLDRVRTDRRYNRAKDELVRFTERLPQGDVLVELGKRWKDSVKEFVYHTMLWEELGFTYVGPVDGHDTRALVDALRQCRNLDGPTFLHVVTQKGKGFAAASDDRERAHAVSAKAAPGAPAAPPKYQDVFAETLIRMARTDPRIVAITAAMPTGTSLGKFQAIFPERFFDVGIAEQHAVTFAAGLAAGGLRPVVCIYSTFLQRAVDGIVHDVALQHLPVLFLLDRAGLVGADGPTHHGTLDLAYLAMVPELVVAAPKDGDELADLVETALARETGPVAIRYPKDNSFHWTPGRAPQVLPLGSWEWLRRGGGPVLVATGALVQEALEAAEGLAARGVDCGVVNARFVKPMDPALLDELAAHPGPLYSLEEGTVLNGFGAMLRGELAARGHAGPFTVLVLPDGWVEHGERRILLHTVGLTGVGLEKRVAQDLGLA